MNFINWILENIHHPWSSVITPYGAWFSYIVAIYFLYVLYLWSSQSFSLHAKVRWLEFAYSYPVWSRFFFGANIEPIKTLAKQDGNDSSDKDLKRFTEGETAIYGNFKTAISNYGTPKKIDFDNGLDYISASGDKGQSPMTIGAWLVVIALSSIEMVSVAQILADFMSNGSMSQSTGNMVGVAFGTVLAGASALFLHATVVEWYKRNAIFTNTKKCKDNAELPAVQIAGLDDTKNDVEHTKCKRLLNRIKDSDEAYGKGKIPSQLFGFLIVVSLMIAVIFGMRYQQFQTSYATVDCYVFQDIDEKSVCEADNARKLIQKEEAKGVIIAGNALFAVIYVLVLMAIAVFSYKRALVGSYSEKAFEHTKGYASYAPMSKEISHAVSVANNLRNKYSSLYSQFSESRLRLGSGEFDRTFVDYLSRNNNNGSLEDGSVKSWYILEDRLNKASV